jgi:hypothetical protein
MTKDEMQLVVKAIDEASAELRAIRNEVHQTGESAQAAGKQVEGLGSKLTSLGQQIKLGAAIELGKDILGGLVDVFGKLASIIPEAVAAGDKWAGTVEQIMRETGLGAEQTSLLLAVMKDAGVPIENVSRITAMFSKNLSQNAALLKQLGIATVDANGKQLDAYTIIGNLRHRFSEYGGSLSQTAAAQKLLGRTGYEMLQFLQLSDAQFARLGQNAAAAGLVLTDDVVKGAHAFNLELGAMGDLVQGAQNSIFAGLLPTMTAFVSAFSGFLKQHLADIVAFVVNAANFAMGVIGGLLGIDFKAIKLSDALGALAAAMKDAGTAGDQAAAGTKKAAAGEDALTKSIRAQIDAIDAQIKKIDEREAKRHAGSERTSLSNAVTAAQSQLSDLEGNAPYTAGLSASEAVLAEQKHNQDILDAKKALAAAVAALTAFDADQHDEAEKQKLEATKSSLQQQLQAHQGHTGAVTKLGAHLVGTNAKDYLKIEAQVKAAYGHMNADALAWRDKGVAWANDLRRGIGSVVDALLGSETAIYNTHDQVVRTTRSGGLFGAFATLASWFKTIGDIGQWLGDRLSDVAGFFTGLGIKLHNWIGGLIDWIHSLFGEAPAGSPLPPRPSGSGAGFAMGGYIPAGSVSRVGEYAAEAIYTMPGGGAWVSSNPSAGGSSDGDGHGHDIYLDGYLVARALNQRNARQHRSTSIRPLAAV